MTTTPGKKPPIELDDEFATEFDPCALCDAELIPVDTGGTYVMEIRHEDDCELLQSLREDES